MWGRRRKCASRRLPELRVILGDVFFCDAAAYTQRILRQRRLSTRAGKLHLGKNNEIDAEHAP